MLSSIEESTPVKSIPQLELSTIVVKSDDDIEFAVPYSNVSCCLGIANLVRDWENNISKPATNSKRTDKDLDQHMRLIQPEASHPVIMIPHVSSLILSKSMRILT